MHIFDVVHIAATIVLYLLFPPASCTKQWEPFPQGLQRNIVKVQKSLTQRSLGNFIVLMIFSSIMRTYDAIPQTKPKKQIKRFFKYQHYHSLLSDQCSPETKLIDTIIISNEQERLKFKAANVCITPQQSQRMSYF